MKKSGEDLRIVKTKSQLCGALEGLLQVFDIGDICIADICQAAKVNRSTFYKHFESKYDFVFFYISTIMNRIAEAFRRDVFPNDSSQFHMESAIAEIQKYEKIVSNLLYSKSAHAPTAIVYGNMVDYFLSSFQDIPFAFPGENPNVAMWSQFYAGGIMTVLLGWLQPSPDGKKPDVQELADFLTALLSNIRIAMSSRQA